ARVGAQRAQVAILVEVVLEVEADLVGLLEPLEGQVAVPGAGQRAGGVVGRGLLAVAGLERGDEAGRGLLVSPVGVRLPCPIELALAASAGPGRGVREQRGRQQDHLEGRTAHGSPPRVVLRTWSWVTLWRPSGVQVDRPFRNWDEPRPIPANLPSNVHTLPL